MKIVVYAGNGGSGGLKGYIKGFLSACGIAPENEIVVICNLKYMEYIRNSVADNVRIAVCEDSGMRLTSYLRGNRLPETVRNLIDQEKPDIVYFMNSIIYAGAEKYLNVVGMHNQLYIDKKQLRRQRWGKTLLSLYIQRHFALQSLKKADAVVLDSKQSLQQCRDNHIRLGMPIVAYFGVEEEERCNSVHTKALGSPIELLYISNVFPYKNQLELVKGLSELKNRGYEFRIRFVGAGPERYVRDLQSKIEEMQLQEQVELLSWVEHTKIKQMIDETDIFVYASAIETSGFGLMEGMVRGAVIACNAESCMPEILGNGGLTFDVYDPINTADTLEKLIKDSMLRQELSRRALETSSAYTWNNHTRVIFDSFCQLLAEKKR